MDAEIMPVGKLDNLVKWVNLFVGFMCPKKPKEEEEEEIVKERMNLTHIYVSYLVVVFL
jgi:hypothetical protein